MFTNIRKICFCKLNNKNIRKLSSNNTNNNNNIDIKYDMIRSDLDNIITKQKIIIGMILPIYMNIIFSAIQVMK